MRYLNPLILAVLMITLGDRTPVIAETQKITVASATALLSVPFLIARDKGYFEDEGLTISYHQTESGKEAFELLLNDPHMDISMATQSPVVFNSFTNDGYVILGGIATSYNDVKIIARDDRGIKSLADLKNKRIGVSKITTSHSFLSLVLTHNIILKSDITLVDIAPPYLLKALAEGRVDAVATWEPNVINARELLKDSAIIMQTPEIYREDFYIVARKEFVQNNPDAVMKFLKAIIRAESYIEKHREDAIATAARIMGLEEGTVSAVWDDFKYHVYFDQVILINLEDEARWMIDEGISKTLKMPNYLKFIDPAPLNELRPEAVTVF